ncbi:Hsp90 cochaperone shq1 [Rhizophlyctis rosea]|uniref:Hsp90 cochaperone shq1 n=1 Tax=Rhizophlyctis rosea TaxID=64517 RepID=A0AAD5X1K1_9FUNG|nr:Hsp90 cochaperone shq1 [Rhizophlyctis rosea]
MLTPAFTVSQDDDFVTVLLTCPYVKAQEVEFYIEGQEFKFFVHPYFLRLTFPGSLIEDGRESASYDIDKGEITVKLPKETSGQHFPDLDLLTKLMATKSQSAATATNTSLVETPALPKPLIEVVGETGPEETSQQPDVPADSDDEDEEIDWEFPQELPKPQLSTGSHYGFNNAYSGHGSHISQVARDIIDILDVEISTPQSRREQRLTREELKFDDDHYMYEEETMSLVSICFVAHMEMHRADFINDEEIQRLIKFRPESWSALKRIQKAKVNAPTPATDPKPAVSEAVAPIPDSDTTMSESTPLDIITSSIPQPQPSTSDPWLDFTDHEQEQMRSLPNKRYLVDDERSIFLGLIDILFAYCYNHRTTEGENTVESFWTICKLSATLSSFETFTSLPDTLQTCIRRSLTYPLYRHFALSVRVIEDVAVLFKLGKRAILKALLEVREILRSDEVGYLLRGLWVDDYCVWVQSASDKTIRNLASELNHIKIGKSDVGFPLEELETLAKEAGNGDEDEEMADS